MNKIRKFNFSRIDRFILKDAADVKTRWSSNTSIPFLGAQRTDLRAVELVGSVGAGTAVRRGARCPRAPRRL